MVVRNTTSGADRPDAVLLICLISSTFFYPFKPVSLYVKESYNCTLSTIFFWQRLLWALNCFMEYYIWPSTTGKTYTETGTQEIRDAKCLLCLFCNTFINFLLLPHKNGAEGSLETHKRYFCSWPFPFTFLPEGKIPRDISLWVCNFAQVLLVRKLSLGGCLRSG